MSSSQALYNRWNEKLSALVAVKNGKRVTNWIGMMVGLLQSQSSKLSQIANDLPMGSKAESRVTWMRRWLTPALPGTARQGRCAPGASVNRQVKVWQVYKEVLEQVWSGGSRVEAYRILEGVRVFGDGWQIFGVSWRHGGRAIPLAWTMVEGHGLVKGAKLKSLLEKTQRFLKG